MPESNELNRDRPHTDKDMEYRPSIRRPRRRIKPRFFPPVRLFPLGLAALLVSLFVLLLRGCAPWVREIGDCVRVSNITNAMYMAYHAGLDI